MGRRRGRGTGQRLPAPVRIIIPVAVALLVLAVVDGLLSGQANPETESVVQMAAGAAVAVGLLVVWSRYIDYRPLAAYGLGGAWLPDFVAGVAIASLVHLGALAVLLGMGWASVTAIGSPGATGSFALGILAAVVSRLFVAVWEELLFRGLFVKNAAEGLSGWFTAKQAVVGAWAVSSVVFGLIHFQAAASPVALTFWILLGGVLGLGYVLTGKLALPIGFHFAYNLVGVHVFNVFGADPAVAGEAVLFATVLRVVPVAGAPETFVGVAGLVNVAFGVFGGLLVLVWAWYHHGLQVDRTIAMWRPR